MSKKAIIISIISIIVVAGGVIGFLLLTKPHQPTTEPAPNPAQLVADTSKDYGACTLLDKAFLKSTLGPVADNLQGPDNLGRIYMQGGDESQQCIYSFVAGGTIDTGFNQANGLTVEVIAFKDESTKASYVEVIENSVATDADIAVEGLGDEATFTYIEKTIESPDAPSFQQTKSALRVLSGLRLYTYTITQPTDVSAFTSDTAQTTLTTIAKSVSYEE